MNETTQIIKAADTELLESLERAPARVEPQRTAVLAGKNVLIIQAQVKQYRAAFFEKLHVALQQDGIRLRVAYSDPDDAEARKRDNVDLPPNYGIKVKGYWAFANRLLYQPLVRQIIDADLVVTEMASKYLMNHVLFCLAALKLKRLGVWWLGEIKRTDRSEISEWYKRIMVKTADWWFAYTMGTADFLAAHGIPRETITNVQNSVDTRDLQRMVEQISKSDARAFRRQLGIGERDPVGVFCGNLERAKGIPFLLHSARIVRQKVRDFHLIIAGSGPDQELLKGNNGEPWIHYVGPAFGRQKAQIFRVADVMLQPGSIGLVIVDAFAGGLPLIATELPSHGPEIEYLESGRNGLMTAHDTETYVRAIVEVLSSPALLEELKSGARASASRYSIEVMAQNFRRGILSCLAES